MHTAASSENATEVGIDKRALAFYQDVTFSPVHIIISDYSVYNYLLKFHPFISFSYPKFGHDGARLSAISQTSLLPGPSRDPTMLPTQTIYIFSAESCKFTLGLLSTGCAWETTKRRHTGSMIIKSLDHLS